MNEIDRLLLNRVNIFLAECYENNTIISPENIITMFSKTFKSDITYIKHCPDGLENSLQDLVKCINENPSNNFKNVLKVLLTSYYDTIRYAQIKDTEMPARDKDRYWYKSLLSEYVLQTILYRNHPGALEHFKSEYSQIGSLIMKFYSEENESKSVIIQSMIKSKLEDIYRRYKYLYDLPALCS